MPQVLLDERQLDARFQEVRGVAVAQGVDVCTLADATVLHRAHKSALETAARDRPHGRIMERGYVTACATGKKPEWIVCGAPEITQEGERALGERHVAVPATFAMDVKEMEKALKAAGGPATATEMGLPRKIWRDAMKYARDVRNRWSFLDLADDAGLLDDFLSRDAQ